MNNDTAIAAARALIAIGAVGFSPERPITFKSGIISPVYVDNRRLPFHPEEWRTVIEGFASVIEEGKLSFDAIAGIETAGIPHSAALGYHLGRPSVFVRKEAKDHGTKKRVEGGDITKKRVLLIEDLVTTGGSSLSGVEALRAEGGTVEDCLVIVTYGFRESEEGFAAARVRLHALTSFPVILGEALAMRKISEAQRTVIDEWFKDPHAWGEAHPSL